MLEDIINENRYPIVFIGSGMSRRYLDNFPNWNELLEEYWAKLQGNKSFYWYKRSIKNSSELNNKSESEKNFITNIRTASYIQEKFDDLFFQGKIIVDGLSDEAAFKGNISPFKFDVANRFKTYTVKDSMKDELKYFSDFLKKAKVIVTTNYDPFIENLLEQNNSKPNIFVGQKGFFDPSTDWGELFKIHGCISDPNSIVITEDDYKKYDTNSILISAKILVNMIESPILFLGYSLSDRNVRSLLRDFASQLPQEDIRKTTNRIAIVSFDKTEHDLSQEMMRDQELDIGYLLIKTDNYKKLYEQISTINEGLSPHEVLRYQKAIKNIIVAAGSKGRLDAVLVSPNQMQDLESQIQEGKNIVVALGNKKNIFVFPDIVSYINDYLFELNDFLPTIALNFAAKDGSRITKTPFRRYLINNEISHLGLDEDIIRKLNNKIETTPTLDTLIASVPNYCKKEYNSICNIKKDCHSQIKLTNEIIYNIKKLDSNDLDAFIKKEAFPLFVKSVKENTSIKSNLRKLFYAYDLLINGDHELIQ